MLAPKPTAFRTDIEGLRGVAILLVVLFHFDLFNISSGFIGVDIFFVISGFLMTQIIMSPGFEWSGSGVFGFYKNRFWRIAPAYYVVLLGILFFFLVYPFFFNLEKTASAFVASTFFSYNVVAPSEADYFGTEAISNPMLHLWSLGVEMQFYLLWPLLLYFVRSRSLRTKMLVVGIVSFLSFSAAQILLLKDPEVAYYSIVGRLWQFGFGASAALLVQNKKITANTAFINRIQLLAIATIIAVVWSTKSELWPGFFAIIPTLACSVLLLTGYLPNSISRSVLSIRPLRLLGAISYSLYLVHWPIFVFINLLMKQDDINDGIRITGLATSVVIAICLYKFIETPFRTKTPRRFIRWRAALPVSVLSVILTVSVFVRNDDLLSLVMPSRYVEVIRLEKEYNQLCGDTETFCLLGAKSKTPTIFLWGDSHAGHLEYGLDKLLRKRNVSAISISNNGCPPLVDMRVNHKKLGYRSCPQNNNSAFGYLSNHQDITTVIIAARWTHYNQNQFAFEKHNNDGSVSRLESEWLIETEEFEQTINSISELDKKVIVVTQAPQFKDREKARDCRMEYLKGYHKPRNCRINEEDKILEQFKLDEMLKDKISVNDSVIIADAKKVFCEGLNCRAFDDDAIYYYDRDHLNSIGSYKIVSQVISSWLFTQ